MNQKNGINAMHCEQPTIQSENIQYRLFTVDIFVQRKRAKPKDNGNVQRCIHIEANVKCTKMMTSQEDFADDHQVERITAKTQPNETNVPYLLFNVTHFAHVTNFRLRECKHALKMYLNVKSNNQY